MKEILSVPNEEDNTNSTTVIEDESRISLAKFSLLVDLYHYYPVLRKTERNISTELYYVLTSNKRGKPQ